MSLGQIMIKVTLSSKMVYQKQNIMIYVSCYAMQAAKEGAPPPPPPSTPQTFTKQPQQQQSGLV